MKLPLESWPAIAHYALAAFEFGAHDTCRLVAPEGNDIYGRFGGRRDVGGTLLSFEGVWTPPRKDRLLEGCSPLEESPFEGHGHAPQVYMQLYELGEGNPKRAGRMSIRPDKLSLVGTPVIPAWELLTRAGLSLGYSPEVVERQTRCFLSAHEHLELPLSFEHRLTHLQQWLASSRS